MEWLVSALGAVVVAVVLRDVFHTLAHPSGQGTIGRLVMALVWRLARGVGLRRRGSALAGPVAMVGVIGAWGVLSVLGWALVYWPHMPEGFAFQSNLAPAARGDFLDAVYLSLVALATLGFGDIVPVTPWLRLAAPLQALMGFVLLTASVSWVLQVYPALTRRRALALRLAMLRRADAAETLRHTETAVPPQLLEALAANVLQARVDLTEYTATYYFREDDPEASLPATLGYAGELADAAQRSARMDRRLAGRTLACALEDFAQIVAHQFLGVDGTTDQILDAYAADQGHRGPEGLRVWRGEPG